MMSSAVAQGCVYSCSGSIIEIPGPIICFSMESSIMQTCLCVRLFLFSYSWGSHPFAFDEDIVSNVSFFLFIFRSLFSFQLQTDYIKSVLFCVGRVRVVLIDSTNEVLFFISFCFMSSLFCISNHRSVFFSGKTNFVSRILLFREYV